MDVASKKVWREDWILKCNQKQNWNKRFGLFLTTDFRLFTRVARWLVFETKNSNLGKFWRKMMVYFMDTWSVLRCYMLWTFGIVRGNLVYCFPFWYFAPRKIWQPLFTLVKTCLQSCYRMYIECCWRTRYLHMYIHTYIPTYNVIGWVLSHNYSCMYLHMYCM
jgi:hypothetical protein